MDKPVEAQVTTARPMVMVSRLSGAWYAAGEGDTPDGWLTLAPADTSWLCIEPTGPNRKGEISMRISNLPGGPAHCFFTGKAKHLPGCGEKILVDLP